MDNKMYAWKIYEKTREPQGREISQWTGFHREGWL